MDLVEAEILALLNGNVTADGVPIKTYYHGEATELARSNLPALMVFGPETEQVAHGTAKDKVTYEITIRVVTDMFEQFTEAGTGGIIKTAQQVRRLMEERDAEGLAKATSVLGILRRNIKGNSFLFTDQFRISYKPNEKNESFVRADMQISVTSDLVFRE